MNKMNYYKISESDLIRLLGNSAELEALINGGVDNWSYYGEALSDYWDEYVESYPAVTKYCQYDDDCFDNYAIGRYRLSDYERI